MTEDEIIEAVNAINQAFMARQVQVVDAMSILCLLLEDVRQFLHCSPDKFLEGVKRGLDAARTGLAQTGDKDAST